MKSKNITNVPVAGPQGGGLRQLLTDVFNQRIGQSIGRLPTVMDNVFSLINGMFVGSPDNMHSYVDNAFLTNSTVYAIVTFCARKFSSIPVFVYRKGKDENAFKAYNYLISTKQWKQAKAYRSKALELAEGTQLGEVLSRPNPIQGGSAFYENLLGFKMITGAGTAWANRPTQREPVELWCLPTQDIVIIVQDRDYMVPSGYQLQTNYIANLRKEDVLYWKYFNPKWSTTGSHLYGLSPLKAAMLDVDENNLAKQASSALMYNQGAKGVVYNAGNESMSEGDRDAIKMRFNELVNGAKNLGRVEVANANLGYINLGMNSVDMGIVGPNSVRSVSKEDLCNIFHFPAPLLSQDNSSYNNYDTAMKALMSNNIIPEWCSFRDDFNAWIQPMYPGQNLWVEPDFSLVPELQKDMEKLSNVVKNLWQLTPNQVLDYLGFEIDDNDEAMNKHYIPNSYTLLEDVGIQAEPIDIGSLDSEDANDYNVPAGKNGKPVPLPPVPTLPIP